MRNICLSAPAFLAALWCAPALAVPPGDLEVIAQAGGVDPDEEVRVVVLDATGNGGACSIHPADRETGACYDETALVFAPGDLDAIWTSIQANAFFGLDSAYVDTTLTGGSWAELTITGSGQTHTVSTQNTAVPSFDAIVTTLNSFLAPAHRLEYNEILP